MGSDEPSGTFASGQAVRLGWHLDWAKGKFNAGEISCNEDFPMALSTIRITGFFVLLAAVVSAGGGLSGFLIPTEAYSNDRPIQVSEQHTGLQLPAEATGSHRAISEAVRVNGTEFRAVVQSRLRIPAHGEEREFKVGLHITNTSDKPVIFADTFRFTVQAASGKRLPSRSDKIENIVPWSRPIERGEDWVFSSTASLKWTPDGQMLRLTGWNNYDSEWWFDGLGPGEYLLRAEYDWVGVGKIETEPVRFTIVPTRTGLKQSKPVRVNGFDFQTVVEPRQGPLQDGMQPITFGLSITNRTDKSLLFNMFDTRGIGLRNAAGQEIHCSYEREETDYTGSVRVGPGKTETVLYDASICPGDGNTLNVFTDESLGTWSILGLVPGKYFLRFGYGNSPKRLEWFLPSAPGPEEIKSYWYGDVETAEVEFEITPPGPAQPNRAQNK